MKAREIRPEKLDALPAAHPEALASRRDLIRLNRLFGTFRWFGEKLPQFSKPSMRMLELGAGDGGLSAFLRRRCDSIESGQSARWNVLDIRPSVTRSTSDLVWHEHDLLTYSQYDQYDVIFGNLILHQFGDSNLGELGERLREKARILVFQEPWRHPVFLWGSYCLTGFIHHVTRHDAAVSVRAGFRGRELPELLGLDSSVWKVILEYSPMGMYRMVALRE